MFVVLVVGLYISRVLLSELGVEDYGIYGVVGSVVTLFSFLNSAMTTAGQRCLSFELGKGISGSFEKMLGAIILSTSIIALSIFIFLEVAGFYFLDTLNIPIERKSAAILVFHASCISFFLTTLQIPFSSSLMAQEKISIFSYISMGDIILRLLVVIILQYVNYDKLIVYPYLLIFSNVVILVILFFNGKYKINISFKISKYQINTITKYFGWNLLGGLSSISLHQGLQIVLNIFFNPAMNAAQSIALQIKSGLESFAANIRIASNPQIIKLSANNNENEMFEILSLSMRFSSIAILMVSVPLFVKIDFILKLWLENPPSYSSIFIRLYIVNAVIDVVSSPIVTVIQAIGDIKRYQIVSSILLLSILPIVYVLYSIGLPPQTYGIVFIFVSTILVWVRISYLFYVTKISGKMIIKDILKQIIILPFFASIIPLFIGLYLEDNIINMFLLILISCISVFISSWILLLKKIEKERIISFAIKKYKK